ncbi:MAG: hypothetical protein IJW82_03620 [Clostridia bacterium]|nr:hypothetical protein [Clostridia bacterium]
MKKRILKVLCFIFIIIYIIYSPTIFISKLRTDILIKKVGDREQKDYKIVELWNIDTFEGGSFSRTNFLEKRAIEFEKENNGIFFIIKNYTVEQAINKINENQKPDMISYGMGFGEYIKNIVLPLIDNNNVRKDLLKYGKINDTLFALPYMLGGYSLIANNNNQENLIKDINNQKIYISQNNYVDMKKVLNKKNLTNFEEIQISTYDMYQDYIKEKYNIILGTQRDVYRCYNRNKNQSFNSEFLFLEGYSDLVQFLSILEDKNFEICGKFIKFLTSQDIQKKLCDIGMFNVLKMEFYSDELYKKFEKTLNNNLESKSLF